MGQVNRASRTEPPPTLVDRLKAHPVIGFVLLAATLATALSVLLGPVRDELREWRASSPAAESNRLAELSAGVSLEQFNNILEDTPDLQRSTEDGLRRNIYERPYVYVLAVTDADSTVVSFAVMVRETDFQPDFGGIVLGQTTPSEAWDTPGGLAGVCGRPVQYFEVSLGPVTAQPKQRAVGFTSLGAADDVQFEPLCQADKQLHACDAYLVADAGLSAEAVECFTSSQPGQRLRSTLRPNVYAEGMPYQDLTYELVTIFEPEIYAFNP